MTPQQIQETIEARCSGAVLEAVFDCAEPYLLIDAMRMGEVARVCKEELGFDRLLIAAGIDFEGYDENGKGKHREINKYGEDGKPVAGKGEGTGDLGMSYHLEAFGTATRFVLKARVGRREPKVATVSEVWPTALWQEREAYDMYGIEFPGHPDLRRLLLPEDWEGWPLRKDYEMPSEWNGVPLEGLALAVREKKEGDQ